MNIEKEWSKATPAFFLRLLSKAYGFAVWSRALFYKTNILHRYSVRPFVVSVGNITAGGTGKTPLTIYICTLFKKLGISTGVVSRGYGRKNINKDRLVSDQSGLLYDSPELTGDEPFLIAKKNSQIPVAVAKKRINGIKILQKISDISVVIMDDGFQHISMRRDLDILLLDAKRPFENGWLLPAGPLREPVKAVNRADLIVLNHWKGTEKHIVQRYKLSEQFENIPIFTGSARPVEFKDNFNNFYPLDKIKGQKCMAFSGIGRHLSFIKELERLGAVIIHDINFKDHQRYTQALVNDIIKKAKEKTVDIIVTTEKDMVKIMDMWSEKQPLLLALNIEMEINEEAEFVDLLKKSLYRHSPDISFLQ